jgi:hypothetical protein
VKTSINGRETTNFQRDLTKDLISVIEEDAIVLSKSIITRMGGEMARAATYEARSLMEAAAEFLDQGQIGTRSFQVITSSSLLPRGPLLGFVRGRAAGSVTWDGLSEPYGSRKRREGFTEGVMVRHGYLRNYLSDYSNSVLSKFGAIEVDVRVAKVGVSHDERSFDRLRSGPSSRSYMLPLGRIEVRIFPNISEGLLPGLASRRWTDLGSSNGELERQFFPAQQAKKLAPNARKFPLILPLTQFWMLVRIPNAIGIALAKFSKTIRETS